MLLPQIPGLLLFHSYSLACPSPARICGDRAMHHLCGCSVEAAASGACGCAERGCPCRCCAASRQKAAAVKRPARQAPAAVQFSPVPCGWPTERVAAGKIEFLFTYLTMALEVHATHLAGEFQPKPKTPFFQPPVPPPELLGFNQ